MNGISNWGTRGAEKKFGFDSQIGEWDAFCAVHLKLV